MRILVTGAGGYIGRHLVPRLRGEGHEVTPLYKWSSEPHESPYGEQTLYGDLSKSCHGLVKDGIRPDTVIHLAGRVDINLLPNPKGVHLPPVPGPCDIGALYRDNVLATANVLQYCLQAEVKHLIFASTQAVYGMGKEECQECGNPAQTPLEYYAASKLAAERLLEIDRQRGLMVSILRLPGVFGGDRKEGAVYSMCMDALQKGEIHVTHLYPLPMNVMHIDDVVSAFTAAVTWQPPNEHWAIGLLGDVAGRESCNLNIIAEEIASLVPECKVWRGVNEQPTMRFWDHGLATRTSWHPKPRKERLAQVLEEIRREGIVG